MKRKNWSFFVRTVKNPFAILVLQQFTATATPKYFWKKRRMKEKAEARSVIESQKKMAQQMRNRIFQIDQNCAKIQEKVANLNKSVQQFVDNIFAVIEAKKQEIINEVQNQGKQSLQQLGIQRNAIEQQAQKIETGIEKSEALLKRSTNPEIAQLDKTLKTIFQEGFTGDEEQVDCDLEGLGRYIFVENETLLEKAINEGIGSFKTLLPKTSALKSNAEGKGINEVITGLEAEFVLTTRNAEGEQCYGERDCVTVEIRNHQGQDCATKARIKDNKDGSYRVSYLAKETGRCNASVQVNEGHIHGSPFVVQVNARPFRSVLSFGKKGYAAGMLKKPWGVAVNERNEIAVTDKGNNRVQLFSSDGTYMRSFGTKGDKQGEFNFPTGIAFDIKNENIYVTDSKNHRVQLFSKQGEYLNQFGGKGNLDHQLQHPSGLSVDSEGNVIVADYGNKEIKIFSPSGQFLRKIGGGGSFKEPWHCVQYGNLLIVSDSEENSIKVFSKEGDFLYKFGREGVGDGEFNKPRCLSVNKAGHLIFCDKLNHRIQVFEVSGKFITKFGTKGSEIGEFNQPLSAAVLSDGRIVVSDFLNHRIQIFE